MTWTVDPVARYVAGRVCASIPSVLRTDDRRIGASQDQGQGIRGAGRWDSVFAVRNCTEIMDPPPPSRRPLIRHYSRALFSSPEIQKVFKISCHIESFDTYMKH